MTTRKRYLKWPIALIVLGLVLLTVALAWPSEAGAHSPRPVACDLARDAAPPGSKYRAQQLCIAAQRKHAAAHAQALRIAQLTRACRHTSPRVLGVGMCRAIAVAKPAWATSWAYHELLRRESTGSPNAVNDASDACGAFQRLVRHPHRNGGRGCPWGFTVIAWRGHLRLELVHASPLTQTIDGVRYIQGRYGSPDAAVRFHNANGYY